MTPREYREAEYTNYRNRSFLRAERLKSQIKVSQSPEDLAYLRQDLKITRQEIRYWNKALERLSSGEAY